MFQQKTMKGSRLKGLHCNASSYALMKWPIIFNGVFGIKKILVQLVQGDQTSFVT